MVSSRKRLYVLLVNTEKPKREPLLSPKTSTMKSKKNAPKRPDARSLKIQPKHRFNRWSTSIVPELILCGKWLEDLGFEKESRVVVHASKELIVIRPEEEQQQ